MSQNIRFSAEIPIWFVFHIDRFAFGPQCLFVERGEGSDGDLFPTAAQDTGRRDWGL